LTGNNPKRFNFAQDKGGATKATVAEAEAFPAKIFTAEMFCAEMANKGLAKRQPFPTLRARAEGQISLLADQHAALRQSKVSWHRRRQLVGWGLLTWVSFIFRLVGAGGGAQVTWNPPDLLP